MVWRLPYSPGHLFMSKVGDRLYGPLARGIYDAFAYIMDMECLLGTVEDVIPRALAPGHVNVCVCASDRLPFSINVTTGPVSLRTYRSSYTASPGARRSTTWRASTASA